MLSFLKKRERWQLNKLVLEIFLKQLPVTHSKLLDPQLMFSKVTASPNDGPRHRSILLRALSHCEG